MTNAVPEGFHTITPTLVLENCAEAMELYKQAFGAMEDYRMMMPDGEKIMHTALTIGSSKLFMSDANPQMAPSAQARFYLYVDAVDEAMDKAKQAGLQEIIPVKDMFWGDRVGAVKDAFGVSWTIATHTRHLTQEEMEQGKKEFFANMAA